MRCDVVIVTQTGFSLLLNTVGFLLFVALRIAAGENTIFCIFVGLTNKCSCWIAAPLNNKSVMIFRNNAWAKKMTMRYTNIRKDGAMENNKVEQKYDDEWMCADGVSILLESKILLRYEFDHMDDTPDS